MVLVGVGVSREQTGAVAPGIYGVSIWRLVSDLKISIER